MGFGGRTVIVWGDGSAKVRGSWMRVVAGRAVPGNEPELDAVPTKVPRFELFVLALGFGLCRAWVISGMSLAAGCTLIPGDPFGYDQVYLFGGAFAAMAVALLAPRLLESRIGLGRLNLANVLLMTVSLLLMTAAVSTATAPLTVVAFLLCGASSAILQVVWGERFVRHSMRLALLASPASAIVTALAMMFLPTGAVYACFYVAPLLSLALLCTNRGGAGSLVLSLRPQPEDAAVPEGAKGENADPISRSTLVRLMVSIGVFSLVGRCLDSFPVAGGEGVPAFFVANYPFLAILVVGVLFIAMVLVLGGRFNTLFVYRLSLPLMVAGFVILTLFMAEFSTMSVTIMTVGYEFFDVLFWVVLVGVVRRGGFAPVFVFGWGVAATYAGMGLGTWLSSAVVPPIMEGRLDVSTLSLICILVLVVLVVLVLPEGTLSKASSAGTRLRGTRRGEDLLVQRCAIVSKRYDLTPRERDVLVLLARGRTLAVVARELSIAEGTARTHMGHIYAKLGVHKQQELIDLVEAVEEDEL